jgi:hypothetical protein
MHNKPVPLANMQKHLTSAIVPKGDIVFYSFASHGIEFSNTTISTDCGSLGGS